MHAFRTLACFCIGVLKFSPPTPSSTTENKVVSVRELSHVGLLGSCSRDSRKRTPFCSVGYSGLCKGGLTREKWDQDWAKVSWKFEVWERSSSMRAAIGVFVPLLKVFMGTGRDWGVPEPFFPPSQALQLDRSPDRKVPPTHLLTLLVLFLQLCSYWNVCSLYVLKQKCKKSGFNYSKQPVRYSFQTLFRD